MDEVAASLLEFEAQSVRQYVTRPQCLPQPGAVGGTGTLAD